MPGMTDDERCRLIPACRRCRVRKIKCDRSAPKCSNCTKASSACIVVDPITSENYPRDYIRQLEEKERLLRSKVDAPTATPVARKDDELGSTPGSLPSNASTARPNAFVGDGSGLSFLRSIFSDAKWQVYKTQILQHLAERPEIPEQAISRNAQPSIEEGLHLLENYFRRFHIHHTFLLRQDVLDVFDRVYHSSLSQPPSAQDHFRLFMVFSISAVTRYRRGLSKEHPYGYYLAAQVYLAHTPLLGSIDAIQNLLLVSRFGMYHHVGTSLWEISRFCTRQCVEHELHTKPNGKTDLLKEQHHRRIFWECYILDRYSSGVLGRPFAITERDITVDLPMDIPDEALLSSTARSLAEVDVSHSGSPTELSVFIFCIHLRRITSQIHSAFYTGRNVASGSSSATPTPQVSSGHVYVKLHRFLDQLHAWREGAPEFAEPRSLYERPEWYDFMMEKDRLLLIRGAIHAAPRRSGHPPGDLLLMCLDSATHLIELYNSMTENKWITWTRCYFQVIFAAGLSIIYCVSLGVHSDATNPEGRQRPAKALTLCGDILHKFKEEMPDAGRFAIVFQVIKDNFLRDSTISTSCDMVEVPNHATMSHEAHLSHDDAMAAMQLASMQVPLNSASWSADIDGSVPHMLPSPINTDDQMSGFGMSTSVPDQDLLLGWPLLTDEMMEHLEAGLGEFAWGMVGTEGYSWDQTGWDM